MNITDELESDFSSALGKIDFKNYDPFSREFCIALRIGLMHMILDDEDEPEEALAVHSEDEESDDVSDELSDARKYIQMYGETKDVTFQRMARDELNHANLLIHRLMADSTDEDLKSRLRERQSELNEITGVLNKM